MITLTTWKFSLSSVRTLSCFCLGYSRCSNCFFQPCLGPHLLSGTMSVVYTLASRSPPRPLVPPSYVNPAQMQNAQAGPSTAPSGPKKKPTPTPATVKRKRTETPEDNSPGSPSPQPQRKGREGPKKKKANRACFHCQKAHLTCDDCSFLITLLSAIYLIDAPFISSASLSTLRETGPRF